VNPGAAETAEPGAVGAWGSPAPQAPKQELIALNDRLLEVFSYSERGCAYYAETVKRYAARLPETIRIYAMLVPMRIEFENAENRRLSDSQDAAIARIYDMLDPRVEKANAYARLKAHKDEYIYFRTDHHWTALGAYYGLLSFAEIAGFDALDIKRYDEHRQPGFLGALYQMAPEASLKNDADEIFWYTLESRNNRVLTYYYDESGEFKSFGGSLLNKSAFKDANYGIFLGGDYPLVKIEGNVKNGRVLAVIKDSYGNAFSSWLPPYFEKILIIDPRSFREDLFGTMDESGVTDLLILDYLKVTMLPAYIDSLNEIIEND
jgi:hypothetical protein